MDYLDIFVNPKCHVYLDNGCLMYCVKKDDIMESEKNNDVYPIQHQCSHEK